MHYCKLSAKSSQKSRTQFIIKACRRDPEQRYQTAQEALAVLGPVAEAAFKSQPSVQRENTTNIFVTMSYAPENRADLHGLLEEFQEKARKLGIQLKVESHE